MTAADVKAHSGGSGSKTRRSDNGVGARRMRSVRSALLALTALFLGGCHAVVLNPAGDLALQQRNLVLIATGLMLLIIIPVMVLTVVFARRYHAAKNAPYAPEWDHSIHLELVIWAAPLLIIICLGAVTWVATHLLDPYRALDRIEAGRPVPDDAQALEVDVVALDWKWLFIYPEYDIATVNDLAAPVGRPIHFRITSSTVMNSFYVPTLAGQIYAMPGMETQLHAVINKPEESSGFSANYSGAGFSGMHFAFHGLEPAAFEQWVAQVRAAHGALDRSGYLELEKPSEDVPPKFYAKVETGLFDAAANLCVEQGARCLNDVMRLDAKGGAGEDSAKESHGLEYDKRARRGGPVPAENDPTLQKPKDEH